MRNKKTPTRRVHDIYILSKILLIITLSVCLASLASLFFITVFSDSFEALFVVASMGTNISLILISLVLGVGAAFALDYAENLKK